MNLLTWITVWMYVKDRFYSTSRRGTSYATDTEIYTIYLLYVSSVLSEVLSVLWYWMSDAPQSRAYTCFISWTWWQIACKSQILWSQMFAIRFSLIFSLTFAYFRLLVNQGCLTQTMLLMWRMMAPPLKVNESLVAWSELFLWRMMAPPLKVNESLVAWSELFLCELKNIYFLSICIIYLALKIYARNHQVMTTFSARIFIWILQYLESCLTWPRLLVL
jgi:hypothetical protein